MLVTATHVHWSNSNVGTIGRANIDGTHVRQAFITGCHGPYGLARDATRIYWTNYDDSTIGRANIDGTHVKQAFITGAIGPAGLAITAQPLTVNWSGQGERIRSARRSCSADPVLEKAPLRSTLTR